jgi:hypothetical protein
METNSTLFFNNNDQTMKELLAEEISTNKKISHNNYNY